MTSTSDFIPRHIGPSDDDIKQMLSLLGVGSLDELMNQAIPEAIRLRRIHAASGGTPQRPRFRSCESPP